MDLENFTAEISYQVEVRIDEITKLHNLQENQDNPAIQNAIRRSSVCLYYAHIEGFVYFVFTHYINTENNVGKNVLQKLLYKVGMDYRIIHHDLYASLAQLLNVRNDIAHGSNLDIIAQEDFDKYYDCTKRVITELENLITVAYTDKKFLKN